MPKSDCRASTNPLTGEQLREFAQFARIGTCEHHALRIHDADRLRRVRTSVCSSKQLGDAGRGEIQQLIELVAAERMAFGRALHFDEAAAIVHDDVHVGLGVGIFGVVEIQHRRATQMPTETAATWPCSGLRE